MADTNVILTTAQTRRRANQESQSNPSTSTGTSTTEEGTEQGRDGSHLNSLIDLDVKWTEYLSICAETDSKYGFLRPYMKLLEISGHGVIWLILPFCYIWTCGVDSDITHTEITVNLLSGVMLDLLITASIKMLVRRPRPQSNKMDMFATVSVDHFSFPSGHSSRVCMLLAFFICEVTLPSLFMYILLTLWSLAVCMSRLLLGRHHIIDIVAGMILGFIEYALLKQAWLPSWLCTQIMQYLGLLP